MNMTRSTLIGTAVAIALFGPDSPAVAQQPQLEEVVVSGIRVSNEKSLAAKRDASTRVEVVTAEDIGKMPDKNVADSLARIPGITTSSASANEGGFDENDRVSMRGTNPSLTQTLINGHNVAAGDWFVLNQVGLVGRSVSYTLLPSELISQVVVNKSSQASLVEGGVAGSVDIITRKPLDFDEALTFQGSVGAVYAEKPGDYDPQLSALFNWKSENAGFMVQAFSETRHLRRDGVEILGYETIDPESDIAESNPDLAGVQYPGLLGAALFEQKRERKGGLADFQFRAGDSLEFDLQGFYSKLDATNYNRNYLLWGSSILAGGNGQAPDPGYVVTNGTLTQATFSPDPGRNYAIYDQISRPDESSNASYVSFEGRYQASDALSFAAQIGTSKGHGKTPTQDVSETVPANGSGASYSLNGMSRGPDFSFGATDNTTPFPGGTPVGFGWIFGGQFIDVKDKEDWARIDGEFKLGDSGFTAIKFGARVNEHKRESANAIAQGPTFGPGNGDDPATYPATWTNYPSDFSAFGGDIPENVWYWTPEQLAEYNGEGQVQRDPVARAYYQFWFSVKEDNAAVYTQADFAGSNWSGNIGVRYVTTKEDSLTYTQTQCTNPDAIQGSLFGCFAPIAVDHTYHDLLPSANLKWDLTDDVVARFAVSKTMTRADYSALAGFTDLTPPPAPDPGDPIGTGSGRGSNPDLKPIRSTNWDAGLEWYFAPGSLASATVFYMDLDNYVSFATETKTYLTYSSDFPNGQDIDYLLSVPVNAKGRVKGFELSYQQAISGNFGVAANYTYADGKQTSRVTNGEDRLVGTSKNTYNVGGYFENERFSARVTYTYRSAFFSGLDRETAFSQDKIGSLAASLNYTFNDSISFSLDGQNLNNPTLKYFASNRDQPRAFYKNGAQYYLTARFKF